MLCDPKVVLIVYQFPCKANHYSVLYSSIKHIDIQSLSATRLMVLPCVTHQWQAYSFMHGFHDIFYKILIPLNPILPPKPFNFLSQGPLGLRSIQRNSTSFVPRQVFRSERHKEPERTRRRRIRTSVINPTLSCIRHSISHA